MSLPTTEQVEKAKLQAEQAKARYQALQARLSEAARKLETRRKIILGGLLLDAAEKDEKFARVVQVLMGRINRDQDSKAFEGWTAPGPELGALAP
jgi:outer membrane PBP1 activator LpoA protein